MLVGGRASKPVGHPVLFPEKVKKRWAKVDFWGHFWEGKIAVTIHDI